MKFLIPLALFVNVAVGQQTAASISATISTLQKSNSLLNSNPFGNANSYQSKARASTMDKLAGTGSGTIKIKEFYVLSCLYHATNSVSNPRTNELIPGTALDPWHRKFGWMTETNHCAWYGIQCSSPTSKVTQIKLPDNNLSGEFPTEILLLGDTLKEIDIYANTYNWKDSYDWFSQMVVLESLVFGSTSWDANGIPTQVSQLKTLIELDFSDTLWRGAITPAAFDNMPLLSYLDMADNSYTTGGSTAADFESTITGLVGLKRFYMDNVKLTDGSTFTLDFIGSMPAILEIWMDSTEFHGGIPANIGDATTLRSLSLSYCSLTGPIPAELANCNLDRMWLFANELTGPIPAVLAQKDWRHLYLEENNLSGNIPSGICSQVGAVGSGALEGLGADCDICQDGCCTCCGDDCGNLEEAAGGGGGIGFCFSGDSEVQVENKGSVKMSSLAVGDYVKVVDNKYEPVYSFGHKNGESSAEFLQIVTNGNRRPLEISKDHMVVVEGGRHVPVSMVKRGDNLVTADGDLVAVKTIRTVMRKGIYAPFTASGSIIINDIAASNYVAFQGSEYLQIAGVDTPFSFHWLAHIFNSVHRVAVMIGFSGESYTESGVSQWVDVPHKCGSWLLEQNAVVALAILLPSIALFGFISVIESLMNSPMVLATLVVGALTLVVARRTVSVKTLKM